MVAGSSGPASTSYENRCAGCKTTGISLEYKEMVHDGTPVWEVVSGYVELNIGCEACHGPGSTHVASGRASDIINPDNFLTMGREGYYAAVEVCGRCHQRGEGIAQFRSASGTVQKKVEPPSKLATGSTTKAVFPLIGESILSYYTDGVGTWDTKSLTGAYDTSTTFPVYIASKSHHQQWEDMEQGKHGGSKQTEVFGSGLVCWICHNVHSVEKPHMIRATMGDAHDNTLCLSCHAASGTLTGATALDQVKNHISAYPSAGGSAKAAAITATNYLQPIKADGTEAKYGLNYYRLGECVSCHLPYTASSGATFTDASGKKQGDIRNHTMKAITSSPATDAPDSCSACHTGR